MSLLLPPSSSPIRNLFDMGQLAELGNTEALSKVPTFREALKAGRDYIKAEPVASAVHMLTLRADGSLWLLYVGPRCWRMVWNFGKP